MMHHGNQVTADLYAPVSFGGGGCGCGGGSNDPHDPNVQGIGYDMWCATDPEGGQHIQNQIVKGAFGGGAFGYSQGGPKGAAIGAVTGAVVGGVNGFGDNVGWW